MEKTKETIFSKALSKLLFIITSMLFIYSMIGLFMPSKALAYDKAKPLIIKYNVPKADIYALPIVKGVALTIDWGDGYVQDYDGTVQFPDHGYDASDVGVKTIKIYGKVYHFGYLGESKKQPTTEPYKSFTQNLVGLEAWGELDCERYGFAFCSNLAGAIPHPSANTFSYISAGGGDLATNDPSKGKFYWYDSIEGGFNNMFYNCSKITSIPSDLFDSASHVRNFSEVFANCTSLGEIPAGLFSKNTKVVTFRNVFEGCTGITSVPENLFANNKDVQDFFGAFAGSGLTSVPAGLFANNTKAISFEKTFYECEDLKTISMSMFSKNTSAETFQETFSHCYSLNVNITPDLFKNTNVKGPNGGTSVGYPDVVRNHDFRTFVDSNGTVYYDAFFKTFELCPNLKDVSLDTPFVGYHMFWGDNLVVNITLSNSVKRMGENCFYACNPGYYGSKVSKSYEGYYHKGEKSYTADKLLKTNLVSTNTVATGYNWYLDNRGDSPVESGIVITGGPYDYDGSGHFPSVTINSTKVTLGSKEPDGSYKVVVSGKDYYIYYNNNINAGTGTVVVKDADKKTLPVNGSNTEYSFKINKRPLQVTADDKTKFKGNPNPTFTYSYKNNVAGETPGFTGALARKTSKDDVGTYTNEIVQGNLDLSDNGKFLKSNYEISFTPGTLIISDKNASGGVPCDFNGGPYTYDGDPHRPTVKLGDLEFNPTSDNSTVTGPDGNPYTIIYENNIDAGTGTVTVKDKDGNPIGVYYFTIKPVVVPVDWTDRSFVYDGKPHVPKGTATKGVVKGETLVLKITGEKTEVGENYPAHAELTSVTGGRAKKENYELDPTTVDTKFKITKEATIKTDVAIYLSNGSKKKDKGNQNYYELKEEVIYYVEWENLGKTFTEDYEIIFETPLDFDIVDSDDGEVDEEERIITWKIKGGMEEGDTEKRTVKLKYTALSKKSLSYERIYPIDKIFIQDEEKDRAAVINIIYKDGATIDFKHILYMLGDAEKPTFRPDDGISRAEGALVLTRIFEMDYLNTTVVGNEFKDITTTYEAAQKAIVKATKIGLISGYSDGTFRPNGKMTRAEFMTILAKYVEYNAQQERVKGITIKDVDDSELFKKAKHWSAKYVVFLKNLNLSQDGVGFTNAEMDAYVQRCEVAELCNKYLFRAPVYDDGKNSLPFTDVSRNHRLYGHIVEATRPTHKDYRVTEDAHEIWD